VTLAPERLDKLAMEMRRGVLILAVLRALTSPHYGYSLRKQLAAIGLEIDEGTLYPLLRRLEGQGLLISSWEQEEGRTRRIYRISADGHSALRLMGEEWHKLNGVLQQLEEKA